MIKDYYSENWYQATGKFIKNAQGRGTIKWCVAPGHMYDIPYLIMGNGENRVVINSGIHGIEGYFGSAAQNMFLDKIADTLPTKLLDKYTIVLIHVINGWGMQNRMREVIDNKNGGLVDLNRNFGVDFDNKSALPQNPKYDLAHNLLLSEPDKINKKNAIKYFRQKHLHDGVWDSISYGQYKHPYGLFYGGAVQMPENKMTLSIYDDVMCGAKSLTSVGLHTGLGRFDRRRAYVSSHLLVSHPHAHKNTQYFSDLLCKTQIVANESAENGPTLLGDLVDCLEVRYATPELPVYTADFEIGTGEFPIMSPIYKRMDMGDARYDLLNHGKINPQTWKNLTESWYPSDARWRNAAMNRAYILFNEMFNSLAKTVLR